MEVKLKGQFNKKRSDGDKNVSRVQDKFKSGGKDFDTEESQETE